MAFYITSAVIRGFLTAFQDYPVYSLLPAIITRLTYLLIFLIWHSVCTLQ